MVDTVTEDGGLIPHDPAAWPDWTASTIPPPLFGFEGVEHGETHIPVAVWDGVNPPHVHRLTAEQAREAAAELHARADVIDPDGAERTWTGDNL